MRSIRIEVGLAALTVAVGLLTAIAVLWVDDLSLRILATTLAGAAILSGLVLGHLARRWMLRVEQLRGWVNLIAGESGNIKREVAPSADAIDRLQLSIIDMLGMRIDQQGTIYRRLEEVVNAIPDGVVVVTPEGLISLVNAAGRPLFGVEDSVIGKSIFDILSRQSFSDALSRARTDDRPVSAALHTVWEDTLHASVAA